MIGPNQPGNGFLQPGMSAKIFLQRPETWLTIQSTCPEITWYFCYQFTPDLPIEMQSY
jgi:hypothetical protein